MIFFSPKSFELEESNSGSKPPLRPATPTMSSFHTKKENVRKKTWDDGVKYKNV